MQYVERLTQSPWPITCTSTKPEYPTFGEPPVDATLWTLPRNQEKGVLGTELSALVSSGFWLTCLAWETIRILARPSTVGVKCVFHKPSAKRKSPLPPSRFKWVDFLLYAFWGLCQAHQHPSGN